MNEYEAKQEARRARLLAAAAKAEAASEAGFKRAMSMIAIIPPGQPILIGHHSEKGHRALLRRHDGAMRRSSELHKLAGKLRDRANGVGEGGISSDDPDAVTKLDDKRSDLERKRDRMKEVNRLYRKKDVAGLAALGYDYEKLQAKIAEAYSWEKQPFPRWQIANLGARIRDAAKRTARIERTRSMTASEETVGIATIISDVDDNRVVIKFPARLTREDYKKVRRYGFVWSPTRGGFCRKLSIGAVEWARQLAQQITTTQEVA